MRTATVQSTCSMTMLPSLCYTQAMPKNCPECGEKLYKEWLADIARYGEFVCRHCLEVLTVKKDDDMPVFALDWTEDFYIVTKYR